MKKLGTKELKALWFEFWQERGFEKIAPSSLVPENDATVLFTTAGMHPLVPYLLGEKHPKGAFLVDTQKCVRTNDIDEVGDNTHCTFFEMLGNWTIGECDKSKMIKNSFDFLTSEKYLGIDKARLAVSVFAGDECAKKDVVAHDAWLDAGLCEDQIFYLPKEHNWWALGGGVGPCGPDTEMFVDTGKEKCCDNCSPACDCGKYIEIWNDVFMQYNVSAAGEAAQLLAKPNIDTGMGLERTVCILNGVKSVYDTGAFKEVIDFIKANVKSDCNLKIKSLRIIADHLRAATFILSDKVVPSFAGQGYVLRRLIRRAVNHCNKIGLELGLIEKIVEIYVNAFSDDYRELIENKDEILSEMTKEVEKFEQTLVLGQKEFEKVISHIPTKTISGKTAFRLYDTFGFPIELTIEMAKEQGFDVDMEGFDDAFSLHKEKSKAGNENFFKGGLADSSDSSAHLHTATHIMLATLRKHFGNQIVQKGSNITPERLRFDFNFDRKMTAEELRLIEDDVNKVIQMAIPVVCEEMTIEAAKTSGAIGIFDSKYADIVKVYTIDGVDKQICGGPHASNTSELGKFKIVKEESSSSGIRRIKAILE
ncbi:MAG: alanine--tRNA ligase [Clostridia bacterium]